MGKIKSLLENPKVIILIFLVILIPVITLLLSLLRPDDKITPKKSYLTPTPIANKIPQDEIIPTPEIKLPPSVIINKLRDVSFQLPPREFPDKLKLFKTTNTQVETEKALEIARLLGFENEPQKRVTQTNTSLSWTENRGQLIFYLESGNIEYLNTDPKQDMVVENSEDAISIAKNALKLLSPYTESLQPDQPNISYYLSSRGDLTKVENFNRADTLEIPFRQNINGIPVFGQYASVAPTHVFIKKRGGLVRISHKNSETITAEGEKNLLSLAEAKERILKGEGTIVLYGQAYHGSELPPPIQTVFNSVELAYFKDSENEFLYPIYVFSGTASVDNRGEKIVVYLPALR